MKSFDGLYEIIKKLRGPGGCPWDKEQTPSSLRESLIEEAYECVEAIGEGDAPHTKEELGDIFLLVTMLSYMHEEEGLFTTQDVLEGISEKLIRRHPHVFSDLKVKDSAEVLDNWAKIKVEKEGRRPKDSILDEVGRSLPPLDKAWKLQKKAAKAGFDWPDALGIKAKILEELDEVFEASGDETNRNGLEEELGDLLFSAVNLCRYYGIEPSIALQRTNAKFTERFCHVEKRMKESGAVMGKENLALMDGFWKEAKEKS